MEKWRGKNKTTLKTNSLLPPTRRQPDIDNISSADKRKGKRWTIGGFFKKISSNRECDTSSSGETSSFSTPVLREKKSKNILKRKSPHRAIRSSLQTKKDVDFEYMRAKPSEVNHLVLPTTESLLPLQHESMHSRSSEGSLDGSSKRLRKDKIKARVEAKRDQLCINSSSDEGSTECEPQNGLKNDICLKKRRIMRTDRFLKRLYKDEMEALKMIGVPQDFNKIIDTNYSFTKDKCSHDNSQYFSPPNTLPKYHCQSPPSIDYQLEIQETENPLVRQTLQYFSDFRKNVNSIENKNNYLKEKKKFDNRRRQTQQIFPVSSNTFNVPSKKSRSQEDIYLDHLPSSQVKVSSQVRQSFVSPYEYASSIDSCYRKPKIDYEKNSSFVNNWKPHENQLQPSNTIEFEDTGIYSRIRSPAQRSEDLLKSDFQPSSIQSRLSPRNHKKKVPETEKYLIEKDVKDSKKRSSKNLEEALYELEEIYNSLHLGDEELLERAEKRSMEEYSNKKIENILSDLERSMNSLNTSKAKKLEIEPNILKDDMAYRRLRSANRPSSDGHAILSNISYLITSPIASRKDSLCVDPNQKVRRNEPNVTLDDVVFRNLQHANNTLKVLEPQPPFGIPLGPITGATESDYLHTKPSKPESRSIYVPRCEPDIVTDDLAFRNLRKDALINDKNNHDSDEKHSWEKRPLTFVAKKKRAVRSLSANLYSLINKNESQDEADLHYESLNENGTGDRSPRFKSEVEFDLGLKKSSNLDINGNQSDEIPLKISEEKSPMKCKANDSNIEESDNMSNKHLGPFTEQEIAVYRQLCQELENLVESTKGFEPSTDKEQLFPNIRLEEAKVCESNTLVKSKFNDEESCNIDKTKPENSTEFDFEKIGSEIINLREKLENFVASNEDLAVSAKDKIINHKDIENVSKGEKENNNELKSQVSEDLGVEKSDESNPKNPVNEKPICSRKGSNSRMASESEGENLSYKEANNVCNADLLLLTIKYVCYITNQIKAHFFLLIAFIFVLSLAI